MKVGSRVLISVDDEELCERLTGRIEAEGYRVATANTVGGALDLFGRERWDAVLLDVRLGEEDGLVVLDGVMKRAPDFPVILLTAHGTIATAVEAMRRGAFGFTTKPFHDDELLQKIAHAIESHQLRREVTHLRRILGGGETEEAGGRLVRLGRHGKGAPPRISTLALRALLEEEPVDLRMEEEEEHDEDFARRVTQLLLTYSDADAAPLPPLRDAREIFERAYLEACVMRSTGNIAVAARLAGRNRTDFYDLLRRHGLSPATFKNG